MKKQYLIGLIIMWSLFIIISFALDYSLIISNNNKVVLNKSVAFIEQLVTANDWNSQHEAVYVPVTESTPANPYLNDSLRDIITTDGMQLTKINPAYMIRQMSEINKINHDIQFHLTSLNPIRPENKADDWETKALQLFRDEKTPELLELVNKDSNQSYRYMVPLITEESCLSCHADQGYKLGDMRGGISITFSAKPYLQAVNREIISDAIVHSIINILVIIALIFFYKKANKYFLIVKMKNSELERINATRDKFFSIIAHDLKNPFNTILGFSELLSEDYDTISEDKRREIATEIYKSSNSIYILLEDLLLWTESQNKNFEHILEDFYLNIIVTEGIEPHLLTAKKKDINIEIDIAEDLKVRINEFALRTIIANLFSNAIKFSHQNGNIKISAVRKDHFIEVSVADCGTGIPQEILSQLFINKKNISTLGTNNERGTGLGLTLCKEFVEKYDGKLWVKSELGKGSTFCFTIPF